MTLRIKSHKNGEFWVYFLVWLFMFASPLFSLTAHASMDNNVVFYWADIFHIWLSLCFFLAAFLIHNFLLTPMLFKRENWKGYLAATLVLICAFQTYQCSHKPADMPPPAEFRQMASPSSAADNDKDVFQRPPMPPNMQPPAGKGLMPVRPPMDAHDIMAFTIMILMLGLNLGVKYFFLSLKRREELEELEKTRLEQQLEYLKYQINPHFFMNTLNNIHALVDVNPEQAKMSILKLSKLMRYMLYDSNNGSVTLEKELAFLRNYVELMKMRYSEKVHIDVQIPTDESSRLVPPLLFISFVENAFKHGVSYVKDSRIKISVEPGEDSVKFYCGNTKAGTLNEQPGGIGLENSRKRLDLIYGTDYTLTVADNEDTYEVTLIIPYIEKEQ